MSVLMDYAVRKKLELEELERKLNLPQKRFYATERDCYLQLHMCREVVGDLLKSMPERFRMCEMTERMQEAHGILNDALKRVYLTAPKSQRNTLDNNAHAVTYAIGVKTPGSIGARSGDTRWGLYLSYADIGTLIGAAKDHCLTCRGSVQEQKSCKLREVFDSMGVDAEHVDGECAYRELI